MSTAGAGVLVHEYCAFDVESLRQLASNVTPDQKFEVKVGVCLTLGYDEILTLHGRDKVAPTVQDTQQVCWVIMCVRWLSIKIALHYIGHTGITPIFLCLSSKHN